MPHFVLAKNNNKRILFNAVSITAQKIFHPAVFFIVPEIERDAIGPPVITESFDCHEFSVRLRFKLHKLAIKSTPSGCYADANRTRVNSRNQNPRRREIPSLSLKIKFAFYKIPSDSLFERLEITDEREIDTPEHREANCHGDETFLHFTTSVTSSGRIILPI